MLVLGLVLIMGGGVAEADESVEALSVAAHYAPVIIQEYGSRPRADVPTRFDFDGDLIATNNWDNLSKFEPTPAIYWDVIATRSHWFVSYGLFYPQDYNRPCLPILCHENDFEGLRLTIRRDGSEFGVPERLETFAHGALSTGSPPFSVWRGVPRVVISSGAGGHALRPYKGISPASRGEVEYSIDGETKYEFIPMLWFWEHRRAVGRDRMWNRLFNYRGQRFHADALPETFASGKFRSYFEVQPFWSVKPFGTSLAAGDWFLDPAWVFCSEHRCGQDYSLDYTYHPYLGDLK